MKINKLYFPVDFYSENSSSNEAHVRKCSFKDYGECYEIKVKEISRLRIAAICTLAIALKEHYKGKSEGEALENPPRFQWLKDFLFPPKGIEYADLVKAKEAESSGKEQS